MHPRERIAYRTAALKQAGLWRDPRDGRARLEGVIDTRSNDYLGLASTAVSRETGFHEPGRLGAGASRVVSGTWEAHDALEAALTAWLRMEACLLFTSGYAANVGALSALVGPGETVISDSLNHASIIDGCRLSRARTIIIPHGDLTALERALADTQGVRWVVFESYYGMDGDSPDLARVRSLCDAADAALVVDEAHALGVFGPEGRGLCADQGVVADVLVGGLGKAFGAQGGFVATSEALRGWLWNRARSFVFSTGASPLLCELIAERLEVIRAADAGRAQLRLLERQLQDRLTRSGVSLPAQRHGPIFPIVFGSEADVLRAADVTAQAGVRCQPIRPPTVPAGSSRLRVILSAAMTSEEVDRTASAIELAWMAREERVQRYGEGGSDAAESAPAELPWVRPSADGTAALLAGHRPVEDRGRPVATAAYSSGAARFVDLRESTEDARGASAGRAAVEAPAHPGALSAFERSSSPTGAGAIPPWGYCWIVLGVGTGVGKTYVAKTLVRELGKAGCAVAGLKPVETGVGESPTDAALLAGASLHVKHPNPHPLYAFRDPVTPALAARRERVSIDVGRIRAWVAEAETTQSASTRHTVLETAGGVFSPLGENLTNLDLASSMGDAIWLLVATDRLGVLHDVTATVEAMRARGARPNFLVLSAPAAPDDSTGTNAAELRRIAGMPPVIELPRDATRPLAALLNAVRL